MSYGHVNGNLVACLVTLGWAWLFLGILFRFKLESHQRVEAIFWFLVMTYIPSLVYVTHLPGRLGKLEWDLADAGKYLILIARNGFEYARESIRTLPQPLSDVAGVIAALLVVFFCIGLRRTYKLISAPFFWVLMILYKVAEKGVDVMRGSKKNKALLIIGEDDDSQLLPEEQADLSTINYGDAREKSKGLVGSWVYRKRRDVEVKNIQAATEVQKVMTNAVRVRTEQIQATRKLYTETRKYKDRTETEQDEAQLEKMRRETEIMRLKKEQAELERQIRELEKDASISLNQPEIYAKALEEEQKKLEHQLAMRAKKEMMDLERLTARAQYIMEWQEEIREKFPDLAEEIFDAFDRLKMEEG